MRPTLRPSHAPLRTAWLCCTLLMLGGLLLAAGCTRFPAERIPKMKWLIMPFEQPTAMSTTPRAIRGWWFGATTIRQNERAGMSMFDTLQRRLTGLDYMYLYSPIELKYYFADKRDLLNKTYPYLSQPEANELLAQVPHIDYARELGADKIIGGRIIRQYMGENRSIHWWWSRLDVEAWVMDVASGQIEWQKKYELRDQFASMNGMQEEAADKIIRDIKRDYLRPLARKN